MMRKPMPRLYREPRQQEPNHYPLLTLIFCVLVVLAICAMVYFLAG